MQTYTYAALFERGAKSGFVVSFPDVPEAITQGRNEADARNMAAEALGMVLLTYLEQGRPLPKGSKRRRDVVAITVEPEVAAKLAVIEAFKTAQITQGELASRLGKDGREVRRILDPNHATKLPALIQALEALGRRLVIGVEEIAA
ncbi:MAG: type II toxin-antitoxin system HicB family antitoxin [Methylobacteriaceae bacterium]|nr:type II toxin-antitoxin system HicB family antitoxin [Methylobacteriaceae bacterium]